MTTPAEGVPEGPAATPGESPAAQSIEEAEWQIMMCLAAGNHGAARRALRAYGDRRGEEGRAEGLRLAARVVEQDCSVSTAQRIRSLAAAPSVDTKWTP
jgi:hypothetical protein